MVKTTLSVTWNLGSIPVLAQKDIFSLIGMHIQEATTERIEWHPGRPTRMDWTPQGDPTAWNVHPAATQAHGMDTPMRPKRMEGTPWGDPSAWVGYP